MWLMSLVRSLVPGLGGREARSRRQQRRPGRPGARLLHLEVLEDRAVPAALLRVAVLGDSLSAPYLNDKLYGTNGDRSWAEQLQRLRAEKVEVFNLAEFGATSGDLLAPGGQAAQAAALVAHDRVDYATVIVGANDVFQHLPTLVAAGPGPFVQGFVAAVTTDVGQTLATVA